jgi:tRNA G18 (ribose-2'-O)-methylase SpoU
MTSKKTTLPNLALNSERHQAALADGDNHWTSWTRNVEDKFKNKSTEEIKSELSKTKFPFAVCVENWINDFNVATCVRNANAFNAECIYYLGTKKLDRRGMLGTYHYTDLIWLETIDNFIKLKEKYIIIGIDNIAGAKNIKSYTWPTDKKVLLVFGSEGVGLTDTMRSFCDDLVYIEQFGSVRSLNCGVASGIVMYDFVSKFNPLMGQRACI